MKKILALVLVLSLVLGTFSFAFADGHLPEDVVGEDSEEAVATLMALGVINGYPDGTYKPERTVTRAEMAKLLVEALGYGELSKGATATFPDVQGTWAESYVGFAASMDIVKGYPDGTFKPSQPMTVDEAMTMVIRALGYTDESLKGTWPTNYKVKALDLDLTEDMSALSGPGLRGDVAILLFNALEVRLVEVDADNAVSYVMNNDESYRLFIDRIGKKVDMAKAEKAADQIVQPEDVYGDDAWDTVIDLTPYLFHTLTYYENRDGEVAYVSDVQTDEFAGTVITNTGTKLTVEDVDGDDEIFDITTNTALFYNGDKADDTTVADLMKDKAEVVVVYDDDDVVLGVVAWEPLVKQVVQEYSSRRPLQLRVTAEYWDLPENDDEELDLDALTVEGDADSLQDIEEDDVVHYYASDNTTKVKLLVIRDTFTGKFTRRVSATEGTFGGQSFDVSVFSSVNLTNESLATTYELILDKDGDIFSLTEYDEEPSVEGYALYVDFAKGTIETDEWDADDSSVDKAPRVKLFTDGGDVVVYALDTEDLTLEAGETLDLGDVTLKVNAAEDEITATFSNGLEMGDLVEIELNDDGVVTSIAKVDYSATDGEFDADEMLVDEYDVTNATVIFNIVVEDNEDEWEVLEMSDLADGEEDLSYVVGDNFHADVITAYGELVAKDVNYAVITDFAEALDEDDEVVYELTLILNGETVTYLTTDDITEDSDILTGVVTLDISSGKVEAINAITGSSITIEEISGRRIQYKDGTATKVMTLDEDVVVFIQDGDYRDDFEAGVLGDLVKGDTITVYGGGEAVLLDLGQYQ